MSILQDYENQADHLGQETIKAISSYLDYLRASGDKVLYSDVIYKKVEWKKFEIWRKTVYNIKHGEGSEGN